MNACMIKQKKWEGMNLKWSTGLEIRGCREPRAPLNVPVAPSNFCGEPKYILLDIQINL